MNVHFKPPKIHWRAYLTRKAIVLLSLVAVTYLAEGWLGHPHLINKAHELTLGALTEHWLFGVPFEEAT